MVDRPRKTTSFSTNRPVAVLMIFTALMVFGFFSYRRLPVTLMPELNYPKLTIRTEYPGAAPEEVENEISRPIEEALGVIGGLKRISSISRAGVSDVVLEFLWGTDMNRALQDVLEKLDLVFLPTEAERPLILRFDPTEDPIMELSLSGMGERYRGDAGLRRLRRLAELQVKRALEPLPGVAAVRVRGGLEEEYHVLLDLRALARLGLSVEWVINRLRQENINLAGGTLQEGRAEYMVRTLNEFRSLQDIADTVLLNRNGQVIRVRDIGKVVRLQKDRTILTHTDGHESVMIDVYKEGDANIVQVAHTVAQAIGSLNTNQTVRFPHPFGKKPLGLAQRLYNDEGAILHIVADRSRFIQNSINDLRQTALLGGVLAVLVLFLFLGDIRTTTIIGISIPMSLLISFAPLNLLGITLNIMSLGGLALGVGMLVDNSIVVLESIYRCREEGDDLITAAVRGTEEVRAAVTASTFTTVAVFFPLVFVEGIAGQAFRDLAIAVVASLLASLLVALYFIPMLASRTTMPVSSSTVSFRSFFRLAAWHRLRRDWDLPTGPFRWLLRGWHLVVFVVMVVCEVPIKILLLLVAFLGWVGIRILKGMGWILLRGVLGPLARLSQTGIRTLQSGYPQVIGRCLQRPGFVLVPALLLLLLAGWGANRLGTELLPEVHQGEFTFEINLPVGTPVEETAATLEPYEQAILADPGPIERLLVTYGYDPDNIKRSDEGEHTARFKVILKPSRDPTTEEQQVLARMRKLFADLPDAQFRVTRPVLFSSEAPIVVEIQCHELSLLRRLSEQVELALKNRPELTDLERTLRPGAPEIQIHYDRDRLTLYGLDLAQVARQVRDMVRGYEATKFNQIDRRIPIVVRLDKPFREHVEDIKHLIINPGAPQPIPLEAVAQIQIGEGPSEIRRVDGKRVAWIRASIAPGYSLSDAVQAVRQTLEKFPWPAQASYTIAGQNEEWERSRPSLYLALGLSLFLVYAIMASQFESLLQPILIMFSVPFAFVGSILGLWLLHVPISILVFLGWILLAGIVVNNAIVLVDYTNILRRRGIPLREAVIQAGRVRLRPILMTTATTVLGLLPMALGLGEGAEIRTPMALTVMFGLLSSTLLTLVVIPLLYYQVEKRLEARAVRAKAETAPAS